MTEKSSDKANATIEGPGKRPTVVDFTDDPGKTDPSFAAEADINNILDHYERTGMVNHLPRGEPQYGDAPDGDYHAHMCVSAELASAEEEGRLDDIGKEKPSEASEEAKEDVTGSDEKSEEKPLQEEESASESE